MRNDAFASVVYCVDRQYRPESRPKNTPESSIMPEKRVSLIFFQLPPTKQKMRERAIKPAKLRQNDTKSPGASMKRVKAPIPPISDDDANIMTKPISLYFACWFMYPSLERSRVDRVLDGDALPVCGRKGRGTTRHADAAAPLST